METDEAHNQQLQNGFLNILHRKIENVQEAAL
jgi:hypothetical protein